MKVLIGIFFLLSSIVLNAENLVSVEWAPFIKAKGVTDKQLVLAASEVNVEFLNKQSGFIKRVLMKKSKSEYADVIHWSSKKEAEEAGKKVFSCAKCNEYFKLMDMKKSADAGSGFSYYKILKTWN